MESFKQSNLNKFYSETELIQSYYYKADKEVTIVTGADMHYHPHVDKELYRLFVKYVRETNPDFIVLPGDLIETVNFIDYVEERVFFENFIQALAEVAPVIIVPGNHEMGNFDVNKIATRNYTFNKKAIDYFETLNRFKNVYFLNNEQTKIKDIMFLGFNPRLATYLKRGDQKTNDMFVEDYLKSSLKMAEADYNILLTHSSMLLSDENVVNRVSDFKQTDLVISGHWHDGYLPKFLDKYLGNTNVGLFFTPRIAPYPGIWCRGVYDFGRGYIFISQGFRKFTADIALFNAFEKFTANDVEKLIISNPEFFQTTEDSKSKKL